MSNKDFLVEILTEELPPKFLQRLSRHFLQEVKLRLEKLQFDFQEIKSFATPRRLALLIPHLSAAQPDQSVERKGPAYKAAFDAQGAPTQACLGFAKSCGVAPEDLAISETPQGKWLTFTQSTPGKTVAEILPQVIQESLLALPVAKKMRWGNHSVEFVRPVHSAIMLYGESIIAGKLFGIDAGRVTQGHRFHCQASVMIDRPDTYEEQLKQAFVIADFSTRRALILTQIKNLKEQKLANVADVILEPELLDEVTGLVEWPVALAGAFNKEFLAVPPEALITAMQSHQRYFPIVNREKGLMPFFITVSNIDSKDPASVIAGNERVLKARLSDAAFFYQLDKQTSLEQRVDELKTIVYHAKLGTVYDKTVRVRKLCQHIADTLHLPTPDILRAALLAKTDLTTAIVNEFPEMQGTAGFYYAQNDNESLEVATALAQYYQPRFSGDTLPSNMTGSVLAIADRIDSLVGIFGINQQPSGDKDPFALRRAALGVARIIIEKEMSLDLRLLLTDAYHNFSEAMANAQAIDEIIHFIKERLKAWYADQSIDADVFAAVSALGLTDFSDAHRRIVAVNDFKKIAEAASLSAANKRVSNILAKADIDDTNSTLDATLFEHDEERLLAEKLQAVSEKIRNESGNYAAILTILATLRAPIDAFFDKVMVMTDDVARRNNRLVLLSKLRASFMQVADIALLTLSK